MSVLNTLFLIQGFKFRAAIPDEDGFKRDGRYRQHLKRISFYNNEIGTNKRAHRVIMVYRESGTMNAVQLAPLCGLFRREAIAALVKTR